MHLCIPPLPGASSSRLPITPNGHAGTQYPQPLQTSSWMTTVPNSVRAIAPVGQTSRQPACAKACPTNSIQFGELDELRERAARRVGELREKGEPLARLYGADPGDGVGGMGAFFLLLDEPEVYGLPPDPVTPTRHLKEIWRSTLAAGTAIAAGAVVAVLAGRRR